MGDSDLETIRAKRLAELKSQYVSKLRNDIITCN